MSMAVIDAIADAENVAPTDLPVVLADVVDPDALDSLFREGGGSVCFEYAGYRVTVDADRDVGVAPLDPVVGVESED